MRAWKPLQLCNVHFTSTKNKEQQSLANSSWEEDSHINTHL